MRQGAQGQCPGLTPGMGWGRKLGGVVQEGEHMYTYGGFMSMYGIKHYSIVK